MSPASSTYDPNWIAAVAAALALLISLFALWQARRNRRSELEQAFVHQRNEINLAFAEHMVKGPFAHLLGIPDDQLKEFIPKVCLFFLQLNLLNDVYQHRKLLPPSALASYETWSRQILAPWIKADKHLLDSLKHIYATEDLMPKDFVHWLKDRIPLN
ncbi:MAG: hypothetical protein IBJ14_16415 [Hydrogenophaga sp.]|nr:hypothetical protein [Hydrogenophaga sp.]